MICCDRCGAKAERLLRLAGVSVAFLCLPCWEEPFRLSYFRLTIETINGEQQIRLEKKS